MGLYTHLSNPNILRITWLLFGLALALSAALTIPLFPTNYSHEVGSVAPYTVKSRVAVPPFVSMYLTGESERQASNSVSDVLVYDPSAVQKQKSAATDLLQRIQAVKDDPSLSPEQKLESLKHLKDHTLSVQVLIYIVEMEDDQWTRVTNEAVRLIGNAMSDKVRPQDLAQVRQSVLSQVSSDFNARQVLVSTEIARSFILPNLSIDLDETEKGRKQAKAQIEPVRLSIAPGETILRDGSIITPVDIEKLEASKLIDPKIQWAQIIGNIGLSVAFCVGLGIYLIKGQLNTPVTPKRVLLLALIIGGIVFAAKLLLPGRELLSYLFPFATGPMLIATLLNPFLAVVVALLLSILVTYSAMLSPELLTFLSPSPLEPLEKITLYFSSSLIGVLMVWQAKRMYQYLAAGIGVGIAGAAIVLVFWLLAPDREVAKLGWAVLGVMSSGFLSAALTVGAFVLLGHIFGITTSFHLMELAHPDHPLLRKLVLEAPGTYYHSLIVSNLAEQAADIIGADSLMARVGAYYHDAGKLINPGFFIENQRAGENIHDKLDPTISASIVISHVKDGVQLANQYHLPHRIKDFMQEHHGTRLASFFYQKALQEKEGVQRTDFEYPGPAPRSKETAIVMLADSIEAMARARGSSDPEDLYALVEEVVAERIAEGQLDNSDLTLQDLAKIKEAFKIALRGVFHPRIQYPQPPPLIESEKAHEEAEAAERINLT